jgi:hypothetical protein
MVTNGSRLASIRLRAYCEAVSRAELAARNWTVRSLTRCSRSAWADRRMASVCFCCRMADLEPSHTSDIMQTA